MLAVVVDPYRRYLRATIGHQRSQICERALLKQIGVFVGDGTGHARPPHSRNSRLLYDSVAGNYSWREAWGAVRRRTLHARPKIGQNRRDTIRNFAEHTLGWVCCMAGNTCVSMRPNHKLSGDGRSSMNSTLQCRRSFARRLVVVL